MKIFVLPDITDCNAPEPAPYLLADSALVTHRKPLFLPDWDEEFRCVPAVAFRVGKLGKTIAPRFAFRYFDGIAPAFTLRAKNLLAELRAAGQPLTEAFSFDGAAAIGEFSPVAEAINEDGAIDCRFEVTKKDEAEKETSDYKEIIADKAAAMLARVSARNQMRTGDLLILPLTAPTFSLELGMNITATLTAHEKPVAELVCRIR